jgi:dihydrofolate reductase
LFRKTRPTSFGNSNNEKGGDICILGGGLLAKSLFEADLIDEVGINVHPVLRGSGIPLFHEMTPINLKLVAVPAVEETGLRLPATNT